MHVGVGHHPLLLFWAWLGSQSAFAQSSVPVVELMDHRPKIEAFFNSLSMETMGDVDQFYDRNVLFEDPVVSIKGRKKLKKYYSGLYTDVKEIRFEFSEHAKNGLVYFVDWTMKLKAKKLNSGEEISLRGCSQIKFDPQSNKVIYHRDYFDMGAFIYEHVPVVGTLVRFVKSRLHEGEE